MTDLHKTIIAIGIANSTAEIRGLPITRRYLPYVIIGLQLLMCLAALGFLYLSGLL